MRCSNDTERLRAAMKRTALCTNCQRALTTKFLFIEQIILHKYEFFHPNKKGGVYSTPTSMSVPFLNRNVILLSLCTVTLKFFSTLKLIFYAPKPKSLVLQAFLKKEKERKLQYQWYHNFRSYLVRERRLELPRRLTHAPQTCLSTCSSTLAWPEGMSYYSRYAENVKS